MLIPLRVVPLNSNTLIPSSSSLSKAVLKVLFRKDTVYTKHD